MTYFVYSIYDKVAENYGSPFCSLNDATATRQFNHQVNNNALAEPTDFELYCLGSFEVSSAKLSVLSEKRFICKGKVIDYVKA